MGPTYDRIWASSSVAGLRFYYSRPSKFLRTTPELSDELWLHIFRLFIPITAQSHDADLDYSPFRAIPMRTCTDSSHYQAALNAKRTLVLVCKLWRAIAAELLYETLRIHHGSVGLQTGLKRSEDELGEGGYGRWPRRVILSPTTLDFDPLNPVLIPRILRRCSRVEVIARDYSSEPNLPLSRARLAQGELFPVMPSLKRLDWRFPISGPKTNFSGHFGLLNDLLSASPNLQYLTFSDAPNSLPWWESTRTFSFPSLTTLRWESEACRLLSGVVGPLWHVPALTNLIIPPFSVELENSLLVPLGPQLRVVEFMESDSGYAYSLDVLRAVFERCPNLRELAFHVSGDVPLREDGVVFGVVPRHIECVRLCFQKVGTGTSTQELCDRIEGHFAVLMERRLFPALNKIVLYGAAWSVLTRESRFSALVDRLGERNYSLEFNGKG